MPRNLGNGNYTLTKQEVFDTASNLTNMATNMGHNLPPGCADEMLKAAQVILALVQVTDGLKRESGVPGLILP